MTKVGILNVTGYAGSELARIVHHHPEIQLMGITGRSAVGKSLGQVFPHLDGIGLTIEEELSGSPDLIFSALPHKASAETVTSFLREGVRVVDLSADFRLRRKSDYEDWYGVTHPSPQYLAEAVFGLPELHGTELTSAHLAASPGCYATAAVLALAPAVSLDLIHPDIIIDGKSGVSGAGRELSLLTHFSEVNESVHAYSLNGHRHLPEITQELSSLGAKEVPRVTFIPHLIPMTRGILNTSYAPLRAHALGANPKNKLLEIYRDFYKSAPFVHVVDNPPMTKHTLGNNLCIIYPTMDPRTNRLVVISCLDNLVKGAAGQAVQSMNLMLGLSETSGLKTLALYP